MRLRRLLLLLLCFAWILPLQAQDDPTPYEIALQRIEEARVSGARELDLSFFGLTEPPFISGNLSVLPAEIGNLSNLQYLWLKNNKLSVLPAEIGNLSNLQRLNLLNNQLSELPAEIGNLSNLQRLILWKNQLSELPAEIGNLRNLRSLVLSNNQLISLPGEIGQLTNLCWLDIGNNNIRHLPSQLGNLTNLTAYTCGLTLNNNPLILPPEEVIAQGTSAVLSYLRGPWWHLQRLIISVALGVGFVVILFLGLRWRSRQL